MNTPALDPQLMYDTREPNLQSQAFNAIHGHAQNTREPTALELDLIKEFQQKDSRFFSSDALRDFANGGPPPQLPPGTTESERRGRAMFDNVPFDGVTTRGICNSCHSGPMLNRAALGNPFGLPPGGLRRHRRVRTESDRQPGLLVRRHESGWKRCRYQRHARPGRDAERSAPERAARRADAAESFFANLFKIPPLWGIKDTARISTTTPRRRSRRSRNITSSSSSPVHVGLRVYEAGSGRHGGIPEAASLTGC